MIIIKGYCMKYGPTIATHAPLENGACMHGLACITNMPVYIKDYKEIFNNMYSPDGTADLFHRKNGIYCIIKLPNVDSSLIDTLKEYKIGCYANKVKKNESGNIVDGKIRYVNLCKSNIEEIESIEAIEEERK